EAYGLGIGSIREEYVQRASRTLQLSLNDPGRLGFLTRRLLELQSARAGGLPMSALRREGRFYTGLKQLAIQSEHGLAQTYQGKQYLPGLCSLLTAMRQANAGYDDDKSTSATERYLLADLGLDLEQLVDKNTRAHLIDTQELRRRYPSGLAKPRHALALNRLSLALSAKCDPPPHKEVASVFKSTRPLPRECKCRQIPETVTLNEVPEGPRRRKQPNPIRITQLAEEAMNTQGAQGTARNGGRPHRDWKTERAAALCGAPARSASGSATSLHQLTYNLYDDMDEIESVIAGPIAPRTNRDKKAEEDGTRVLRKTHRIYYKVSWKPTVISQAALEAYRAMGYQTSSERYACHRFGPIAAAQRQGRWANGTLDAAARKRTILAHTVINTEPCNPDVDVHPTGRYHIQIGLCGMNIDNGRRTPTPDPEGYDVARVYDPRGRCVGKLTTGRLVLLRQRYEHTRENSSARGDFAEDLARLLLRYKPGNQNKRKGRVDEKGECALAPDLGQALIEGMGVQTELLATPLNASPNTTCYYAPHEEDQLFGANHDAYSRPFQGISIAHPAPTPTDSERALAWAVASAQAVYDSETPCATIVMVPKDATATYLII
ncbi:hypothetical protein TSOC_013507, partial [Tetrabaena socialis]